MIKFYRSTRCQTCAEVEEALKTMVVAHEVIVVEPGRRPADLAPDTPLPVLLDNGRTISGQPAITSYLAELEQFVSDWRKFQGDACYCDE